MAVSNKTNSDINYHTSLLVIFDERKGEIINHENENNLNKTVEQKLENNCVCVAKEAKRVKPANTNTCPQST